MLSAMDASLRPLADVLLSAHEEVPAVAHSSMLNAASLVAALPGASILSSAIHAVTSAAAGAVSSLAPAATPPRRVPRQRRRGDAAEATTQVFDGDASEEEIDAPRTASRPQEMMAPPLDAHVTLRADMAQQMLVLANALSRPLP
jgi:hypothetical protein